MSCAHVFGLPGPEVYLPGPFENRDSSPVGIVRFSEIAPRKRDGEDCNLVAMPFASRLDLSIAEWTPSSSEAASLMEPMPASQALRPVAKMSPYQKVTFTGKESGTVEAQLSGVTLWHEIEFKDFGDGPSGFRCFGAIFEMSDFRRDRDELAKPGDSGAWIFDDVGDVRCWNGMLIGRQGKRAYGCYAEFIVNAVANHPAFPGGLAISW